MGNIAIRSHATSVGCWFNDERGYTFNSGEFQAISGISLGVVKQIGLPFDPVDKLIVRLYNAEPVTFEPTNLIKTFDLPLPGNAVFYYTDESALDFYYGDFTISAPLTPDTYYVISIAPDPPLEFNIGGVGGVCSWRGFQNFPPGMVEELLNITTGWIKSGTSWSENSLVLMVMPNMYLAGEKESVCPVCPPFPWWWLVVAGVGGFVLGKASKEPNERGPTR